MAELSSERILQWAKDCVSSRASCCLISCTAIKSAPVIAKLEQASGLPVLTSNQCMVWHLLRSNGIDSAAGSYGHLFSIGAGGGN
jgi:maleate cis-trans isomerase